MTASDKDLFDKIKEVIEANARDLGEQPSLGVRVLRDGRVRIYPLATGWRRRPYREYVSLERAYDAALESRTNAVRAKALIGDGKTVGEAVDTVTRYYRGWQA